MKSFKDHIKTAGKLEDWLDEHSGMVREYIPYAVNKLPWIHKGGFKCGRVYTYPSNKQFDVIWFDCDIQETAEGTFTNKLRPEYPEIAIHIAHLARSQMSQYYKDILEPVAHKFQAIDAYAPAFRVKLT